MKPEPTEEQRKQFEERAKNQLCGFKQMMKEAFDVAAEEFCESVLENMSDDAAYNARIQARNIILNYLTDEPWAKDEVERLALAPYLPSIRMKIYESCKPQLEAQIIEDLKEELKQTKDAWRSERTRNAH